jgi:benzoate membrane transport protein
LAAGIALLIGASNLTILGVNSTFWSIVAGVVLARFLRQDEEENSEDSEVKE